MKTKLFYKIFAFTFGMMLLITVLAHVLIFMIAPSENVLITSTTVTNEDVLAFSEVDMPQLITQTILGFPIISHHEKLHSDIYLHLQRPPKIERLANFEPIGRCKIPLN